MKHGKICKRQLRPTPWIILDAVRHIFEICSESGREGSLYLPLQHILVGIARNLALKKIVHAVRLQLAVQLDDQMTRSHPKMLLQILIGQ